MTSCTSSLTGPVRTSMASSCPAGTTTNTRTPGGRPYLADWTAARAPARSTPTAVLDRDSTVVHPDFELLERGHVGRQAQCLVGGQVDREGGRADRAAAHPQLVPTGAHRNPRRVASFQIGNRAAVQLHPEPPSRPGGPGPGSANDQLAGLLRRGGANRGVRLRAGVERVLPPELAGKDAGHGRSCSVRRW